MISYLQAGKRELKPGENQLEKQVTECEQAKQQLQQTSNLLASLLLQLVTEYRQTETQLKNAIGENESLKQTIQELQQKSATLERERDEARETLTKLRLENTLLEQKVEQLESHKKVLIQELGGSLSGQDIEFITWEFLIQKVKEVTNQLNEVIARNQSLIKTNRDLQQEKDVLRRELNQVKDNNTRLTQTNSQLQANKNSLESELRRTLDRIKPLERAKDKLEQEKAKVTSIEQKTKDLEKVKNQLEIELKQEKSNTVPLEQKVKNLEQAKNQLDAELKQEKSKLAPIEQKNKSLEQVRNQLETALNQEKIRVAVLERETNSLRISKNEGRSESRNATEENDELIRKINQLNQTIKQLEEKIKQLEYNHNPGSLEQEQKRYIRHCNNLDVPEDIDLLERYNNLVYFVQESLNCSGIEELEDWGKTEDFYVELITRLCFIDAILITKIESLESEFPFIHDENANHTLSITFKYPGKFLFWSNGEVRWELSSFFNSKL